MARHVDLLLSRIFIYLIEFDSATAGRSADLFGRGAAKVGPFTYLVHTLVHYVVRQQSAELANDFNQHFLK